MPIKNIELSITKHRPVKRETSIECNACPGTPWTIDHLYDQIKAACNVDD